MVLKKLWRRLIRNVMQLSNAKQMWHEPNQISWPQKLNHLSTTTKRLTQIRLFGSYRWNTSGTDRKKMVWGFWKVFEFFFLNRKGYWWDSWFRIFHFFFIDFTHLFCKRIDWWAWSERPWLIRLSGRASDGETKPCMSVMISSAISSLKNSLSLIDELFSNWLFVDKFCRAETNLIFQFAQINYNRNASHPHIWKNDSNSDVTIYNNHAFVTVCVTL